ncbi:MAG TPA: hypothetical protein VH591_03095 [Ktedonobacterales bacterium]|jgi:hypothetical protein
MAQTHRERPAALQQWTTAQLVEALRAWDINYLTISRRIEHGPADDGITKRPPISGLLPALARSVEPRVRDAVIGLLLLHPEISRDVARVVSRARSQGEDELAEQLITLALAALYLQRIWWLQLSLAYGAFSELDETQFAPWWSERNLPSPSVGYGESGLRWLAIHEQ